MIKTIKSGTLVRRIEYFQPNHVLCHHKAKLDSSIHPVSFIMKKSKLSPEMIAAFDIEPLDNHDVRVIAKQDVDILLPDHTNIGVSSAGSVPTGFNLDNLYNSHHHPRGLKLAVYGMSDALNSLGFEWSSLFDHIKPDQVSVYAGSGLSQVDEYSMAGVIGQPLLGNRVNSKMMALSLAEMPADFVNSYIINSVGSTGHNLGACATFLYNLKLGIQDIQSGRSRVVIIGGAEAPIVPEVIEGFRVMGALATDEQLCAIDGSSEPDNRRACRPFSTNAGFTLAESAQFFVIMDDELALTVGAKIYGSVADVFVNADGNKKSIAGPGIGNYITVAKAAALARAMLGKKGLSETYVQAHGTGTPQNRTTESHILNEVAKTFEIKSWPVAAIKSYLGHSIAVAGGDQLATSLGVWEYGWIPGIKTIDHIASDVYQSNLDILMDHRYVGEAGREMKAVILNSKGFGGNNATALVLSPEETLKILSKRYSALQLNAYWEKNKLTSSVIQARDLEACRGEERIVYEFGESVMDQSSICMTQTTLSLSEFDQLIDLPLVNPYED
jgi:acetoacetyl-[acyl-carrier protein] synthase